MAMNDHKEALLNGKIDEESIINQERSIEEDTTLVTGNTNSIPSDQNIEMHDDQCKCIIGIGCLHDLSPFETKELPREMVERVSKKECEEKCEACGKIKHFFNVLFKKKK